MPDPSDIPDPPDYETIAALAGKMLVARGIGLPQHGEPWHLVQVSKPAETGNLNEMPILSFEALFLTPGKRESSTYIFTDADNGLIGAMHCATFISPTGATCMRSLFTNVAQPPEIPPDKHAEEEF